MMTQPRIRPHIFIKAILLSSASLSCGIPVAALAQVADSAPEQDATSEPPQTSMAPSDETGRRQGNELADIVVTARKQATGESLQSAPLAITAIDVGSLNIAQGTSLIDVGHLAPNVQFQTSAAFPGIANFTIRGLSLNSSLRTLDPTVTIVVDGMPYADPLATILDTFDVESIEILRGPQGVLVGRNATGGAVVIETRKPPRKFELEASTRIGNGGRFDQTFYVGGPIAGDTIRAKLAIAHRSLDGLSPDHNGGTVVPATSNPSGTTPYNSTEDQVGENTLIVRPAVTVETGPVQATLIGEYIHSKAGGNNSRLLFQQPILKQQFGYTAPPFSYEVDHNGPDDYTLETKRLALQAEWDVGVGVLNSATGYRAVDVHGSSDNDGTPFFLFHFPDNTNTGHQFSEELRFSSTFSDRLTLLVGGYYSDLYLESTETRRINTILATPTPPFVEIYQFGNYSQKSRTAAAFGNLDFEVIDSLTLSAGVRYTYEKKALDIAPIRTCAGPGLTNCPATRAQNDHSFNNISPRFAVNLQATPDILLYASYTKGFRSGNYNGRATSLLGATPSDPELAKSYEAGFKSEFFNHHLRFNAAGFYTNYDNIQKVLTGSDAVQRIVNAASARIYGAEAEVSVLPFRGLQLDGSFGWTHAQYQEFNGLDLTGDSVPDPDLAKQLEFERVPEFQYTVSGTYQWDVGNIGHFLAKSSYAWVDHQAAEVTNVPALEIPAHGLWDASLSYEPNDNIRLTAFGKNLSNVDYWDIGVNFRWGPTVSGGQGRTYGLEMAVKF